MFLYRTNINMNQCEYHQWPLHQCKSKYEIAIWILRLTMTISIRLRRHIQGLIPMWVLELFSIRSKLIFVTIQFGFLRLETHMDTVAWPLLIISIVFYKGRSRDDFLLYLSNWFAEQPTDCKQYWIFPIKTTASSSLYNCIFLYIELKNIIFF